MFLQPKVCVIVGCVETIGFEMTVHLKKKFPLESVERLHWEEI